MLVRASSGAKPGIVGDVYQKLCSVDDERTDQFRIHHFEADGRRETTFGKRKYSGLIA
jgi:hypothetical protein